MTSAAIALLALVDFALAAPGVPVVADQLREASGLVASRRHPGILWTHNDSGDGPRLFAIREDGTLIATYTLTGAVARDWEDIALGPGPKRSADYLYIGDIGNNCECRTDLSVYRVPEPDLPVTPPASAIPVVGAERIPYTFPGKPANAEALLVDPRDGGLYLVDKVVTNTARLWRFPASAAGRSVTLVEEARLSLPIPDPCESAYLITGGDVAADGSAVLLTTYTHVLRWDRGGKQGFASAMRGVPKIIRRHAFPSVESLAVHPNGVEYWVLPEGERPLLSRYSSSVTGAASASPGRRGVIDDFEDGDLDNAMGASGQACFPGHWFASGTGAAGLPAPVMAPTPDAGGRALRVTLTRTAGGSAPAGLFVFTGLSSNWSPLDLTAARGLRFRYRTGSAASLRVRLEGVAGGTWYKGEAAFVKEIPAGREWRTADLRWSEFAQARTACPGPMCVPSFSPGGIFMIAWEMPPAAGAPELWLDEIELPGLPE